MIISERIKASFRKEVSTHSASGSEETCITNKSLMSYLLLQRHGNSYTLTSGISQGYLQRPFRKLRPQEMKGNYGKVDKVLASKSET